MALLAEGFEPVSFLPSFFFFFFKKKKTRFLKGSVRLPKTKLKKTPNGQVSFAPSPGFPPQWALADFGEILA